MLPVSFTLKPYIHTKLQNVRWCQNGYRKYIRHLILLRIRERKYCLFRPEKRNKRAFVHMFRSTGLVKES